ncbi:cupin domain-containing protein [Agromyces silvae]|uniref:cupin domain-containing protein n=1 Tax=Agromyces silvae TaxID=3388266 RepID=UPI00280A94C0|nr:cupin domain-containing protein [Agromyces protaetiae]
MTFTSWPEPSARIPLEHIGPTVPPEQLISGDPIASRLRIHAEGAVSSGLWEVTPGEFVSIKDNMTEVMHFISGAGTIEHPDGTITTIEPGAVLVVGPGWRGIWRVSETTRKFFVAYQTAA